jgi:hypothetical protein
MHPSLFFQLSSAATAAEQDKKRDYDYPDAFVVEDIAKTVVHICSVSPPSDIASGLLSAGKQQKQDQRLLARPLLCMQQRVFILSVIILCPP